MSTFALVGAGLAGAKTAEALRAAGFDGRITLHGAEAHHPYERPALSKGYLQGGTERDSVRVHPASWYAEHDVDLLLDDPVTEIDLADHRLATAGGHTLRYDKLLLATGATPRRLPVPGADLAGVLHLRTLDDSDLLRARLRPGARIVVVGGGWIGLESAAAARGAAAEVTVLESAELPLLGVLGPRIARVFADLHTGHGVDLRCGVTVTGIRPRPDDPGVVGAVALADGTEIAADTVVVGIGVTPNDGLARAAGLAVDNGIVVDEHLRSSDPDVVAAGDVANAHHPLLGRRVRVEHWANALNQPAVAAATMLGTTATYDRLPYFYTDQYDLGMEYTGHVVPGQDAEVVVRGDVAGRKFIAFWLQERRVVAAMNVNVWEVTATLNGLIRSGAVVDLARLADERVPLADLS
ncbi:NAD(P)/FAD-dependent oxidoreductase [Pseudonocardia sp. CA-107938]|uniref:NAD(P)/FAD-dependent oxidoreductase n=1 Tax=Pseudonocardia sp. CA-107938 TaxID=3240021 RepID=UPI003D89BA8F